MISKEVALKQLVSINQRVAMVIFELYHAKYFDSEKFDWDDLKLVVEESKALFLSLEFKEEYEV